MDRKERIELLNRELREIADLLTGIDACAEIPPILIRMAHDKALFLAEGLNLLQQESNRVSRSASQEACTIAEEPADTQSGLKAAVAESINEASVPIVVVAEPVVSRSLDHEAVTAKQQPNSEQNIPAKKAVVAEPLKRQAVSVEEAFDKVFKSYSNEPVKSAKDSDLRRLLTLNDRFLFQRELFHGDIGMLNYALDEVNKLNSLAEAEAFVTEKFHWEPEASGVKEFMELLERHFNHPLIQ